MSSTNRRRFYRIPTRLQAFSRLMSSELERALFRDVLDNTRLSERNLAQLGKWGLPLGSFLNDVNQKLDMLFQLSYLNHLSQDFPLNLDITEISGSGLKFTSKETYEVGQRMEVVLLLGRVPPKLSSVVGEITRADEEEGMTNYILQFTDVLETSQDAIVKFVFQQQGQMIRSSR